MITIEWAGQKSAIDPAKVPRALIKKSSDIRILADDGIFPDREIAEFFAHCASLAGIQADPDEVQAEFLKDDMFRLSVIGILFIVYAME